MAQRAKRPCVTCGVLTTTGRCDKHKRDIRPSASARGYDATWRKARAHYIKSHPFCVEHLKSGRYVPAQVVDHIKPHKGNFNLMWSVSNWQSLCKSCHDRKTALHDSGLNTR